MTKWCNWRWGSRTQAGFSASKAEHLCFDVEMVAHMLHLQCCGTCHTALSMEAMGSMQPVIKFIVLANLCVVCPCRSMHVTQLNMIAIRNTARSVTLIPLHLCSDTVGLSPIAGA